MKDQRKTKAQLIKELSEMRLRVSEMEASEAEREQAEERIRHLNAVLRAMRNVNQLITKEKNLGRLLHGICDNLVENRGYLNAWIALLDEFKGLVATAEAGLGQAFQPIVQRLRRGMFMGCGQKALARPGVVVTEDPFSECVDCPLAAEYGGRGAMTISLEFEGSVYGLLAVSVPRHLAMDEEEQALFREVAEDIAFALRNIELEEGRKLAGESLRLAAAYARNLVETCLDPFVTIDEEGKVTDVNAAAEEITGCSREELIGTEFFDYFTDPEKVKESHQKAFSQGSARDYEFEVRHRDGQVTPVLHNVSVYRDETGKVAGVVAAARDVTEWKKAEQALKDSEARYRVLFETCVDGVLVADNKTKKFRYANPAICEMLGYTEEELTQKGIQDIHPKESLEYVFAEFKAQLTGKRAFGRDVPCLKSDGTIFYVDLSAGISIVDGRECSIGFFRDT
ncbi:MAG: PAS domain S-box protein, partial [Thermodesulfobacteriota bacterium]|nr:PAS domain S-box protein [Thermodesulfobacteriota bacterium]